MKDYAYQLHRPQGVVTLTRLFDHQELRAGLVVVPPHSPVLLHTRDHTHELFDAANGCDPITQSPNHPKETHP